MYTRYLQQTTELSVDSYRMHTANIHFIASNILESKTYTVTSFLSKNVRHTIALL